MSRMKTEARLYLLLATMLAIIMFFVARAMSRRNIAFGTMSLTGNGLELTR